MLESKRFAYVEDDPSLGAASAMPYIPVRLEYGQTTVPVNALVDSGSTLNVMPFAVGQQLGAVWEEETVRVRLTGNLADADARAILVTATIANFEPVRLAFAWTQNNHVPVILGQVNFFMEFDVCFFRSQSTFQINPKHSNRSEQVHRGTAKE